MIHKTAQVDSKHIGKNTKIWQFCIVLPEAKIGKNCQICSHCFIENNVIIGDGVTIKNGVQIWDGLRIMDNVFVGPNVTFTNDKYPKSKQYPNTFEKTILRKGVSIGANSTLLGGIEIEENSLIGAGSIVTKSIPKNQIWWGSPASFKKNI